MSKLQNERLNQMIENALSYKQEVKKIKYHSLHKRIKDLILKPKVYGLTFTSLIISCIALYIAVSKVHNNFAVISGRFKSPFSISSFNSK